MRKKHGNPASVKIVRRPEIEKEVELARELERLDGMVPRCPRCRQRLLVESRQAPPPGIDFRVIVWRCPKCGQRHWEKGSRWAGGTWGGAWTQSSLYRHLADDSGVAVVAAYAPAGTDVRKDSVGETPAMRHDTLWKTLKQRGVSFCECLLKWLSANGDAWETRAFAIYDISFDDAVKIAAKYRQRTLIYKDATTCAKYCVKDGRFGEVSRYFRNCGTYQLSLVDVRDIFSSVPPMTGKENLAANLIALYEVQRPRPSYFETGETFLRLFGGPGTTAK